jgi:hypothetical protein
MRSSLSIIVSAVGGVIRYGDAVRLADNQISESEFWTRYFTSQLWEQHRASVRKATNEEVNKKKDDIFDLYLEDPDWGIEPRKEAEELVGRVIDLAATEQDHGDVSGYAILAV